MNNQQVSVGINKSDNEWVVKVGEKGGFTYHRFPTEDDAQRFAKEARKRLGLLT
ncbi:hypothetical protein [Brucella intermedia]|uniref:hypothetical protein n=1 Tax=Brucella intermedia TaxID=94625 RepID=UPI00224B774F|nr:hypothetical protein [Brucella intermedia]